MTAVLSHLERCRICFRWSPANPFAALCRHGAKLYAAYKRECARRRA